MKIQSKKTLRFPVLNNVEYFDLVKDRQVVLQLTGDELEGKTWRELQLLIGTKLPPGLYRYSFKLKSSNEVERGSVRSLSSKNSKVQTMDDKSVYELNKKIDSLALKLNGVDNGSDRFLGMQKQIFETQIDLLKGNIADKDRAIRKLEDEIEKLERELSVSDDKISELESQTGITQWLEIGKQFLNMKTGKAQPLKDFSMSDQSDIPASIIKSLGVVAWSEVDPETIQSIENYLNIFIQKLPLKESHGT